MIRHVVLELDNARLLWHTLVHINPKVKQTRLAHARARVPVLKLPVHFHLAQVT